MEYTSGNLDKIRFSDEALNPAQWLAAPEPTSLARVALAGLGLMFRRKQ